MDSDKNESLGTLSDQAKVISLFQFIQELNKLKQKAILNIPGLSLFRIYLMTPKIFSYITQTGLRRK